MAGLSPEIVTRILEARGKLGAFRNPQETARLSGKETGIRTVFYLLEYSD